MRKPGAGCSPLFTVPFDTEQPSAIQGSRPRSLHSNRLPAVAGRGGVDWLLFAGNTVYSTPLICKLSIVVTHFWKREPLQGGGRGKSEIPAGA